jgi:hypothetical protein
MASNDLPTPGGVEIFHIQLLSEVANDATVASGLKGFHGSLS